MKPPLIVTVYRGEDALALLVPSRAIVAPRPSRARARCTGVGTSLLVNVIIAVVLVRGTQVAGLPWSATGRQDADPTPAMVVEFLAAEVAEQLAAPVLTTDDPLVTWTVPPPGELVIAPPQVELTVDEPPPVPETGAASPDESRPVQEDERLRGIYAGQIEGRIERAWTRDDDWMEDVLSRRCSVKVEQSGEGEVQRVEFLDCPQFPDWKRNLESAIRQASPLPAPPERAVFASVIYLDIDAALHVRLAERTITGP